MRRARVVGVDFGRVRIGIAVSDPLTTFAQPVGAFPAQQAIEQLEQIRFRDGIATIVLGWPLQLDGTEGESARQVAEFEEKLRNVFPGIEIVRWDERLSSLEARRAILASGAKRRQRRIKGNVDAVAAAIILQSYLDQ